ncbi:HEAT repeat domain-containing protein [Reichenbachiella agarivorans]|uniref:HEAT repeat domain-containing protein n=1 Tax=Reichenbachiella agarivorans TaxID=2979464 RepID=A0ABY6CUX6_9BACT|nr:HEAT repeat domain-containing protein [Reichenbachiella agarivorans]UXP32040.1 HEAT repeat domain-containing protein [Reichenbachiella agarivorans]
MIDTKNRFLFLLLSILCLVACSEEKPRQAAYTRPEIDPDPVVDFLSPEETIASFYMPEGYRAELVASEPMINEPVAIAWDANGRLYVAQMDTYMQDIDGNDQGMPWSKIMLLDDEDGDGKMDKSTVFVDSLVLPRVIQPVDDGLIVQETYYRHFWLYRDTDGDGKADEKKLLLEDQTMDRSNLEHQPGSMIWNIDNWLYLSKGNLRYRYTSGTLEVDTMRSPPNGQWGLTQDETGRMYYSSAGGEVPALGFQIHPVYGDLEMKGKWEEGFEKVWPVVGTPDVQGGSWRLREEGTLNHFTASCGQTLFLGDRLDAYGDLFIPEPVGRLVRRAKVENRDGQIILSNAYEETEFLAATDANFRPVDTKVGPDGCLYIVDMYRGIIQEGNWVRKGSYLRPVVERKKLDKNIGKGRIYRIVHEDMPPANREKLMDKSTEELLSYLGHPSGWYRMQAQKLIILRREEGIVSELQAKALETKPWLGGDDKDYDLQRLHALWTLEGMDALDRQLLVELLDDDDARVRAAAIRNTEPYLAQGDEAMLQLLSERIEDPSKDVQIQLGLSMRWSKSPEAKNVIYQLMRNDRHNMVLAYTGEEGLKEEPPIEKQLMEKHKLLPGGRKRSLVKGYYTYQGLCADCHGKQGEGLGDIAPPLKGSPRVKGQPVSLAKIVLNGLQGPVDGKNYTGVMIAMKEQDNEWIADVLTYVRTELNGMDPVTPWQVQNARNQSKGKDGFWTLEALYLNK